MIAGIFRVTDLANFTKKKEWFAVIASIIHPKGK